MPDIQSFELIMKDKVTATKCFEIGLLLYSFNVNSW